MAIVLVAEDDSDNRDLIVFKLKQAGHSDDATENGQAALRAAAEQTPDVALLDVMMPGMSGLDVCRALRERPETAQSTPPSAFGCHLPVPGRI